MYITKKIKFLLMFLTNYFMSFVSCVAMPPKGFVYLHEVDPTIIISLRYYTPENFTGAQVPGYRKPVIILTQQAADGLKKVQEDIKKDGYCLVVYDAYRPEQAIDHFMKWGEDANDQSKKKSYYPRVKKKDVIQLGYVAKKSDHNIGSTIDLTIIKDGQKTHPIIEQDRLLLDGYSIKFLDDGTVDMGSSFDLFDKASHVTNNLIPEENKKLRKYLRSMMEKHGFQGFTTEWWHFTLKYEPFGAIQQKSPFNFPIE